MDTTSDRIYWIKEAEVLEKLPLLPNQSEFKINILTYKEPVNITCYHIQKY